MKFIWFLNCAFLVFCLGATAWAQTSFEVQFPDVKTAGLTYFQPNAFFSEFSAPNFPEMTRLNPQKFSDLSGLMNYLQAEGIPLAIGEGINREVSFDLHHPLISLSKNRPAANFGANEKSEVGNLYFIAHDAYHMYAGLPGFRLKDLDNLAQTRARFVKAMIVEEQIATTWSALDYIKAYWNFRNENAAHPKPNFEKLNRGAFSMNAVTREDVVKQVEHFAHGHVLDYAKFLNKNMNTDYMRDADEAGVPNLSIDMSAFFSKPIERFINRVAGPVVESIYSYIRGFSGYSAFKNYADQMADYYLQDWYVRWSDKYQVGYDLDQLENRHQKLLSDLKHGTQLLDVGTTTSEIFEVMFLRNELATFGRKIAEIKEFIRQRPELLKNTGTTEQLKILEALDAKAAHVTKTILAAKKAEFRNVNVALFAKQVYGSWAEIQTSAVREVKIKKIFPKAYLNSYADYDHFWNDPTAFILEKPGMLTGFFPPKDLAQKAQLLREKTALKPAKGIKRHLENYVSDLAASYNTAQEAMPARVSSQIDTQKSVYVQRLDQTIKQIYAQVYDVAIPKILESSLDFEQKQMAIKLLKSYAEDTALRITQLKQSYSDFFKNSEKLDLEKQMLIREKSTRAFVEAGLQVTFIFMTESKTRPSQGLEKFKIGMSNLALVKPSHLEFTQFPIIIPPGSFGKTRKAQQQRLSDENELNKTKGLLMVDLIHPEILKQTGQIKMDVVKKYLKWVEFYPQMNVNPNRSCKALF